MTRYSAVLIAALTATTFSAPVHSAELIGSTIDVPYEHNFGRVHYWCAAGQAVIRAGLPVTTTIYRASPKHRSAGQGMSFSLDGSITGPWNSFATHTAANMCHEGSSNEEYNPDRGFRNLISSFF